MTTEDVVYSLRFSLIKILPEPGFDLGSTAGESSVLTAKLHMLFVFVFIYADDICLIAPGAFGMQKMFDVCFNFSLRNDIMLNPVKSICVTFKPKTSKLPCPNVRIDSNILEYISKTKYLGFMLNTNAQDGDNMLRQMRTLYIWSNKMLRPFHYCFPDVKLEFTICFLLFMVTAYKQSTFVKLSVAFNNAYRRVLIVSHAMTMQRQCMYVKFWDLVFVFWLLYVKFWYNNFEAININYIYGFTQRLAISTNLLIIKIEKPWIVRKL